MAQTAPIQYRDVVPAIARAFEQVHGRIDALGLARALHHLVQLRASQINACGYCVEMHARDARKDGETDQRLDHLAAWEHSAGYSDAERAALAWTEALTVLDRRTDYGALRARLRAHFSEEQIGALTAEIAMINVWNRINVSNH